jgi:hypothetical protein
MSLKSLVSLSISYLGSVCEDGQTDRHDLPIMAERIRIHTSPLECYCPRNLCVTCSNKKSVILRKCSFWLGGKFTLASVVIQRTWLAALRVVSDRLHVIAFKSMPTRGNETPLTDGRSSFPERWTQQLACPPVLCLWNSFICADCSNIENETSD